MKQYYIYIMTNRSKTLYTGVTNNLQRRMYEHKHHLVARFTSTYHIARLVYVEETSNVYAAIARENVICLVSWPFSAMINAKNWPVRRFETVFEH